MRLFENVRADVRYALRSFSSSPGVMVAAVGGIAVGDRHQHGPLHGSERLSATRGGGARRRASSSRSTKSSKARVNARPRSVNGSQQHVLVLGVRNVSRQRANAVGGARVHTWRRLTPRSGGAAPRVSARQLRIVQLLRRAARAAGRRAQFRAGRVRERKWPAEVVLAHEVWLSAFARRSCDRRSKHRSEPPAVHRRRRSARRLRGHRLLARAVLRADLGAELADSRASTSSATMT